jgi:hypothetical protein
VQKDEFGEWLQDPRTKEVFEAVRSYRSKWEQILLSGSTLRASNPVEATAEAIGVLKGIDYLLSGNQMLWDD